MKPVFRTGLLCLVLISWFPKDLRSCTTLIAGKNTTSDGSIIFAKSEDDQEGKLDYYWHIPSKHHDIPSTIMETGGLQIPQVDTTYAYFWDQTPKMMFSNVLINEWGVAFGSDGCHSKEDPVEILEKRGDIVDGGLGFRLRFILAERSRTAREAVLLAVELLDRYGYNGSGRCLNIVDPGEAWQLQMVRGMHYVARRVRDDEVAIIANTFSIREVDAEDTVNFICSPDLIEYAIRRGWYNPETDGAFDFARAYAAEEAHTGNGNTHRTWILASLVQKDFPLSITEAEAGKMPVSVIPGRKLNLQEIMGMFRDHYENTELCRYCDTRISPHYVRHSPVCNDRTHKVNIIQQRNWLPREIGTVNWRALGHPCQSVFIPWYLGINEIPEAYQMATEDPNETDKNLPTYHFMVPERELRNMDMHSASCVFRLLGELCDADYASYIARIRDTFGEMESELLNNQQIFEERALGLYDADRDLAISTLTDYSCNQAMRGFRLAKRIITELVNK
ncbi:MAG: C69 family dipeptidase [Bacteroidales bacterium]